MARKLAILPKGTRITDYISLGVITKTFPLNTIHRVLRETGKASVRQRALPAHVMVYRPVQKSCQGNRLPGSTCSLLFS